MDIRFEASSSSGNFGIVDDGKSILFLDAGVPFKKIQVAVDFDFGRVAGVLLSHCHLQLDHAKAIKDLVKRGIDCFMSEDTAKALKLEDNYRVHALEPTTIYRIGSFDVMPFDVKHDVRNFGYLFNSMETHKKGVYVVDTPYCQYKFPGINYFCTEVNYVKEVLDKNAVFGDIHGGLRNRIVESHFSLEHAIEFFKANDLSRAEKIYLLHLSNGNSNEALIKDKIQKATGVMVEVVSG